MLIPQTVVRVLFEKETGEVVCEAHAGAGERLLDVCDAAAAPVPFSCRDASCGTCLVHVRRGAELLGPPALHEARLLIRLGAAADARLACQARIGADEGDLQLAPAS
jgi:adenylate cyclase